MPQFVIYTLRSLSQVKRAPGFQGGSLLPDRSWTFWTMTQWQSQAAMRAYMLGGAHKAAMPKLIDWCDEASVVHWEQDAQELPTWEQANCRMRADGRISKVRFPSADHAAMNYREPRPSSGGPIRPATP